MAVNIRNAELTGETEAVTKAVRDRLEWVKRSRRGRSLADELDAIARECAALPLLDSRTAGEILGYDEHGLSR